MAWSNITLTILLAGPLYAVAFVGQPSLKLHSAQSVSRPEYKMSMMAKPIQLPVEGDSMEVFKETVLQSELPVLVDFHAVWCAPCFMVAPIMEKMAQDFEEKLKVVKVDCDAHKDVMNHYRARGLPLFIIFNGGELIARHEGSLEYDGVVQLLDKKLPGCGFK